MHTICQTYAYDYVHDTTSVSKILTELPATNQNRNMRDAPSNNYIGPRSSANLVNANLLYINELVNADKPDKDATTSPHGDSWSRVGRMRSWPSIRPTSSLPAFKPTI